MPAHAEGALAGTEHLDLAGLVGLHPEDRLVLADVAEKGTEDQAGIQAPDPLVRGATPVYVVGRGGGASASGPLDPRGLPRADAQSAAGARPEGDGARLAGRGAARRAVPLRGRDPGLPLAGRSRPPSRRLPGRGRRAPAADRGGDEDVRDPGRPRRAGAAAAAGRAHMAHRFIVGETPREAVKPIRHLWEHGAAVSLDLLGEATVTSAEADRYAERCMDAPRDARRRGARLARRARCSRRTRSGRCRA